MTNMSAENADVLSSRIFHFDVDKDGKSFAIHSLLISKSSPVFGAMMGGQMKEALEGRVRLEQVDHETFLRFAEYLYGNDYNAAEALVVPEQYEQDILRDADSQKPPTDETAQVIPDDEPFGEPARVMEDDWATFSLTPKKTKHKRNSRKPNRFPSLEALGEFALPQFETESFPRFQNKPTRNDVDLMYDYSAILSHVKLYAFAEKYQIENLKRLVLHKLHSALFQTEFHPRQMHEFIDILALAYESTPDTHEKEPLRDLLTLFGAWHFPDLTTSQDFQHLIQDHGRCVVDLCQKVARRL